MRRHGGGQADDELGQTVSRDGRHPSLPSPDTHAAPHIKRSLFPFFFTLLDLPVLGPFRGLVTSCTFCLRGSESVSV